MKYPPVIKRGNGESLYRWVFPCFPIKAIFKLAFSSQPRLVTPEVAPYFHRHKHRSWVKRSAGSAQPLGRSPGKLGNPRCGSRRTLRGPPELRKVEWNTFFSPKCLNGLIFKWHELRVKHGETMILTPKWPKGVRDLDQPPKHHWGQDSMQVAIDYSRKTHTC